MSELLNRDDVMRILQISHSTLWRHMRSGRIQAPFAVPGAGRDKPRVFWTKQYIETLRRQREGVAS